LDTAPNIDVANNPNAKAAAEAISEAVRLEPSSRQRIKNLMDPNAADNDLAVFSGPSSPVQVAVG
jgi:hypothetical protein